MDPFSRLHLPLLTQILQQLPLQQRLSQAALVCKAWAAAAAAATVDVQCTLAPGSRHGWFEAWLEQHAHQLVGLQLEQPHRETAHFRLQLPCHKLKALRQLELQGFELHLCIADSTGTGSSEAGSSSRTAEEGSAAAAAQVLLPRLQLLKLHSVQLSSIDVLLQLAQGPQVTSLQLHHLRIKPGYNAGCYHNTEAATQQVAAAMPGLLQQLPRLAVLKVPGLPISNAAAQQLGRMHGLKHVSLDHVRQVSAFDLRFLPNSITQLELSSSRPFRSDSNPSLSPDLQQFTGLLVLELKYCAVPPAVLAGVPQLQRLYMCSCTLLPTTDDNQHFSTEGTTALLAVLATLRSLRHLHLQLGELDTVSVPAQQFSTLTASSHLTELEIDSENFIPLARGAAPHMFPAGRQLPLLQRLTISPVEIDTDPPGPDEWCIDSTDIASICKGCPGLQSLDIFGTVRPGADLSELLQLPQSCTSLIVGGVAFADAAASVVVQLTQLSELWWCYSPGFTDVGLEQLTALTGLTGLSVYSCTLSDEVSPDDPSDVELKQQPEASVSEQLDALCDNSPVCAPARLKRKQAKVQQLRRQLAERDAQIEQLQQLLLAAQSSQQQ